MSIQGGIIEALNTKVDLDLENLSPAGKNSLSNLASISGRYVSFSLGAKGTTYIAPGDGWFYLSLTTEGQNPAEYVEMINNTTSFSTYKRKVDGNRNAIIVDSIPAQKGNLITINYDDSYTIRSAILKFFYLNGSNQE